MYRCFFKKISLFFFFFLITFFYSYSAFAQPEEEMKMLRLFYKEEELVVTPTRNPKPVSQVAENITVITSEDIEMMNAHTLSDVLNTASGVQVFTGGASPGSISQVLIQGSEARHVTVFLDGINLNNLSDNVAELGVMPVQNIEKIEIIKGPASSAWGSSLGGVINIITKSEGKEEKLRGKLSMSYEERNTGDFRAEAYGRKDRFGYYLNGGRLQTDGLRPNEAFSENNIYTKFSYDVSKDTNIVLSVLYNKGDRDEGDFSAYDQFFSDKFENLLSSLSLNTSINKEIALSLSLRAGRQFIHYFGDIISTGERVDDRYYDDRKYGASAKLTWKHEKHNVVIGTDYDEGASRSNVFIPDKLEIRKWAVFFNDTIALNKFSITPGIRYDNTDTNGDFTSPSLGITYDLSKDTLLRAYITRGFSIPALSYTTGDTLYYRHNPDLKPEEVWSYQLGAETGALKYLWLKVSAFRHDIKDGIVSESLPGGLFTKINEEKLRRQGMEIELKTVPVYHTILFAGAAFINTENLNTGEEVKNVPTNTYDIGLKYDDKKSFKAILKGHYIWWNYTADYQGKYDAFIFDFNLIKGLYKKNGHTFEVFLTAHNIFNGSQYWAGIYKNPERWVEAGMRYKF